MERLPTKEELLELATKCLIVNKEVASLKNKTMTRRLKTNLKVDDVFWLREPAKIDSFSGGKIFFNYSDGERNIIPFPCRLYVERTKGYKVDYPMWLIEPKGVPNGCIKEMARKFYRVTSVHSEMLQDITLDDIQKEGLIHNESLLRNHGVTIENQLRRAWTLLWNSTAKAPYRWEDNPEVQVVEYKEIEYSG